MSENNTTNASAANLSKYDLPIDTVVVRSGAKNYAVVKETGKDGTLRIRVSEVVAIAEGLRVVGWTQPFGGVRVSLAVDGWADLSGAIQQVAKAEMDLRGA